MPLPLGGAPRNSLLVLEGMLARNQLFMLLSGDSKHYELGEVAGVRVRGRAAQRRIAAPSCPSKTYARVVGALAVAWLLVSAEPAGATCSVPNALTNGQVADAAQVMGNFNAVTTCVNGMVASSGTVTSVATNNGLTGGPVTAAGTIGIDVSSSVAGQVMTSNGPSTSPSWAAPTRGGLWANQLSATPTASLTGLSNLAGTGAATSNTAVGQYISGTSGGVAAYTMSVPATPYSIAALIATNAGVPALGWTDLTKYHFIFSAASGPGNVIVQANSNLNTWSATSANIGSGTGNFKMIWLKIRDDGANVTFSYSNDGVNFRTAYTAAKSTAFLGAFGYSHIFVGSPGGGDATVLSWTQGS
jgi:hypothetical protein